METRRHSIRGRFRVMENDPLRDATLVEIALSGSSSSKYSYAVAGEKKERSDVFLLSWRRKHFGSFVIIQS